MCSVRLSCRRRRRRRAPPSAAGERCHSQASCSPACLPTCPALVAARARADVSDLNNGVLRSISLDGVNQSAPWGAVTTFAGNQGLGAFPGGGLVDGVGTNALFTRPAGLAYLHVGPNSDGAVIVADYGNSAIRIVAVANATVTTVAGGAAVGSSDGVGSAATFNLPDGVCATVYPTVFVADTANGLIRAIALDGWSPGNVSTVAGGGSGGAGGADGDGTAASFGGPNSCAFDGSASIYVVDGYISGGSGYSTVRKMGRGFPFTVTTIAGTSGTAGWANGHGNVALFNEPSGIAMSASGTTLYVGDENNNVLRSVSLVAGSGTGALYYVETIAGGLGGTASGFANGPGANATMPRGLPTSPA